MEGLKAKVLLRATQDCNVKNKILKCANFDRNAKSFPVKRGLNVFFLTFCE